MCVLLVYTSAPGSTDKALVSAAEHPPMEDVHQQLLLLSQPPRHTPPGDVPQFSGVTREREREREREKDWSY